jgi:hypothetical protein
VEDDCLVAVEMEYMAVVRMKPPMASLEEGWALWKAGRKDLHM